MSLFSQEYYVTVVAIPANSQVLRKNIKLYRQTELLIYRRIEI